MLRDLKTSLNHGWREAMPYFCNIAITFNNLFDLEWGIWKLKTFMYIFNTIQYTYKGKEKILCVSLLVIYHRNSLWLTERKGYHVVCRICKNVAEPVLEIGKDSTFQGGERGKIWMCIFHKETWTLFFC